MCSPISLHNQLNNARSALLPQALTIWFRRRVCTRRAATPRSSCVPPTRARSPSKPSPYRRSSRRQSADFPTASRSHTSAKASGSSGPTSSITTTSSRQQSPSSRFGLGLFCEAQFRNHLSVAILFSVHVRKKRLQISVSDQFHRKEHVWIQPPRSAAPVVFALRVLLVFIWRSLLFNRIWLFSFQAGLERYHAVGIIGFNCPEWFIADLGAIFAGYESYLVKYLFCAVVPHHLHGHSDLECEKIIILCDLFAVDLLPAFTQRTRPRLATTSQKTAKRMSLSLKTTSNCRKYSKFEISYRT